VSRLIKAFVFAIILLGLTASGARAELAISVGSSTVAPDGIGTVDITITPNHGHTLSDFGLELQITPVGATSFLQFTSSQPDPYGNSNYVFYNQSLKQLLDLPFWSVPSSPPSPLVSITGGDSSSLGYVFIPKGSTEYLATVQFEAAPGATVGDKFTISLVNDPGQTYFDNKNGQPLYYTSTPGTVMVVSAVPEPSSSTVVLLSGLSGLLWCYWRGRRHRQSKNLPLPTSIDPR